MRRIVSVWLPHWPLERLRRSAPARAPCEQPFALILKCTHGLRLSAVNGRAVVAGLRPGMTLADARAVVVGLAVGMGEPERDQEALMRLAEWCGRYGPARNVAHNVARNVDRPGLLSAPADVGSREHGLWIDITGVAHLFGGEAGLLADLMRRLAVHGLTARAGLADTHGAAFALARHATRQGEPWRIAPPDATKAAIAALPVAGLRLGEATLRLLGRLGLARIGDLYGLPRSAIECRFRSGVPARAGTAKDARAAAGAVLMRLDQALGLTAEPLAPLVEPARYLVRLAVEQPLISSAGVEEAVVRLAEELCLSLAAAQAGGRTFILSLYRVDGSVGAARVATSAPTRAASHLVRLLAERLPHLDAGFGVDVATLAAVRVEPLAGDTPALGPALGISEASSRDGQSRPVAHLVDSLVDSLVNRLGPECVFRLARAPSHIPERSEVRLPAMPALAGASLQEKPALPTGLAPVSAPRPLVLLVRPEAIDVLADVPDGPPVRLVWRRATRRIVRAEGPERIAPEWWRALGAATRVPPAAGAAVDPRTRDYYRLEDGAGARYWVFRAGRYGGEAPPRWFMHGLYG